MSQIKKIQARNKRVEADKAWETSFTRKAIIALLTYGIVVIFLMSIQAPKPWVNAIVPMLGFVLSTLTLPMVKNFWIKKIYVN